MTKHFEIIDHGEQGFVIAGLSRAEAVDAIFGPTFMPKLLEQFPGLKDLAATRKSDHRVQFNADGSVELVAIR